MSRFVEDPDDPDHVFDLDEVEAVGRMRVEHRLAEQIPVDPERHERLVREEEAIEEPPDPPRAPRRLRWFLSLYALFVPLALLVRLVTTPWRDELRRRAQRREDRERALAVEAVLAADREVADAPDDADARMRRGLALLAVAETLRAEADFDACISLLEPIEDRKEQLGAAYQNRGAARLRMRLPKLAERDVRHRTELLGPLPRDPFVTSVEAYRALRIGLASLAGLDAD